MSCTHFIPAVNPLVGDSAAETATRAFQQVAVLRHLFDQCDPSALDFDEARGVAHTLTAVNGALHHLLLSLADDANVHVSGTAYHDVRVVFSDQELEKIQRLAEEWDCEPSEAVSRLVAENLGEKKAAG